MRLAKIDLDALDTKLSGVEILVACDVDNPLTGEHGAAAVYGPQKGASADDVVLLDDLVVVGEGSLDEQTLRGKAPVGVGRAAGIASARALTDPEPAPRMSMAEAAQLLEEVGRRIAAEELPG